MRGSQSDRATTEHRHHQPPADREQQAWPPRSAGGARPHAEPEQDYDKNVGSIGASRPYGLPDAAQSRSAGPAISEEMRSKLTAPPIETEAPQPSERPGLRSLSRWLIVILIIGAALAAWIYREEVGLVAAGLLNRFRSTH